MQQMNWARRHSRYAGGKSSRHKVFAGIVLVASAVLVGLAFAYLLRRPLYNAGATMLQPWLTAYNQDSLNRLLQQPVGMGATPQQLDSAAISGPLRTSAANPRYFVDGAGKAVYLTGSHTWSNLQDNGNGTPPQAFDYDKYLDFLVASNHNFFRLWVWEQSRWTVETPDDNYWFYPETPYVRTGPGNALDGKPKFDLDQLNQAYFDRMRERIIAAGDRGMYVSIMLFDGFSVSKFKASQGKNPWLGHPFNAANNISGVDGDTNDDDSGEEVHTLDNPAVLAYQQAYVRKVIDTVNDLDNVLYEISNESYVSATQWQHSMIDFIKEYEAGKPKQHPVGMTAQTWPQGTDADLLTSNADWISPSGGDYKTDPPAHSGDKVIIADTDHLWGIGGDYVWVWKSFTRGLNPIFMDCYDGAAYGVGGVGCNFSDPVWVKLRANLGYTRAYAQRVNLTAMAPREDLCSTGYCLANPTAPGAEFIVYQPNRAGSFTVNLAGLSGSLAVEWLDPDNGSTHAGAAVNAGATISFTPPFGSDGGAVLFLQQHTPTPTPTQISTPQPTATRLAVTPTANVYLPAVNGDAGATVPALRTHP